MKRKKLALVAVGLALGFGAAAGAARSGLLGVLVIGGKGHPAASGIQVHGKWTLLVRNTHGKVVARRRFENALTADGAKTLIGILSGGQAVNLGLMPGNNYAGGYSVIGGQGIQLDDGTAPNSFKGCNLIINLNLCVAQHTDGSPASSEPGSGSLHVSYSGSAMVLQASIAPPAATTFTGVETMLKLCSFDAGGFILDPGQCAGEDGAQAHWLPLTAKSITPLSVLAGQSVSATVQLSFS
jgi:hypothetical protein